MTDQKSSKSANKHANQEKYNQQFTRDDMTNHSRPLSDVENAEIEKALENAGLGARPNNAIVMDELDKQGLDKAIENAVILPNTSFNIAGFALLVSTVSSGFYGAYQAGLIAQAYNWVMNFFA